jgi:hypothetical protein
MRLDRAFAMIDRSLAPLMPGQRPQDRPEYWYKARKRAMARHLVLRAQAPASTS